MENVLQVLDKFIERKVSELKTKDQRISDLWTRNTELVEENKMLRNELFELSKEYFKK